MTAATSFLLRAGATGMLLLVLLPLVLLRPAAAGLYNPTTFTLDNGLQVVVIEDHRAPVVTQMVWYRIGSADEPPGTSGIAHFLEHLMFKGTATVPPGEFSRIVARNGGRDNAFTSQDYTGYFQDVAKDKLELVMQLESDRMANLRLTAEVVDPERLVILEERRQRIDNEPGAMLSEQIAAAQYLAYPYRIPVIGWEHEMRGLGLDDAIAFYRAHYVPNNAILIVAGDVEPAAVRALAERYYGPIPRRDDLAPRRRVEEPPHIAARRVVMEDARAAQPSWNRTYLAPSRSFGETRHALPLVALAEILGGGSTSRLYKALVLDDGVAAGAGAWYDSISLGPSRFGVYANPKPGGSVEAVEAKVDAVLATLLHEGITEAELERAKTGLLAGAIYSRDNVSSAARLFGAALTSGLTVEDVENWPERIRAVSVEEVNAAAHYVLDMRRSVTGVLLPKPAS